MTDILHDAGLALRRLSKAPLFSVFSVLTLALGIGITTTAYSILYGLLWRDPAVTDPSRLLALARPIAWADYRDFRDQQTVFADVAAHAEFSTALTVHDTAELIRGEAVSGNYFQTLGLTARVGRLLQPSDDESDAPPAVVLSTAVWRSQFGADPAVVGTSVRLARRVFAVVGIAPDRFSGTDVVTMRPVAAWISLETARAAAPDLGPPYSGGFNPGSRDAGWLTILARLAPGRTRPDAAAETDAIARRLDTSAPLRLPAGIGTVNTRDPTRDWALRPALDRSRLAETTATEVARVILAVPALVLLVACTNLANLVLSRGLARRHEQSVRQSLGASRWRLLRGPLIESAVVSVLGGIGGTLVTWALLRWSATAFERTFGSLTPVRLEGRLEPAVLAVTGVAMLIALAVSGILPALRLTRGNLQRFLATDGAASGMRWRGRGNLIALQVSVSVALFLLAALAVRTLPAMRQAPGPGRDLARAAVVEVPFRWQLPDLQRTRLTVDAVLAEVAGTQQAQAAAVAGLTTSKGVSVTRPERPFAPQAPGDFVEMIAGTTGMFAALDLPVVAGRRFDGHDTPGAPPVAIVNEALARTLFGPSAPALERQILVRDYTRAAASGSDVETLTIVGVAADSTLDRRGRPDPVMYRPFAQRPDPDVAFVARSASLDSSALVTVLRTAVRRADADIAIRYAGNAQARFQMQAIAVGLATGVIALLAAIALVLAMAGLYGVLSYVVYHRTREIGVRMALGASAGRIVRLVVRDGLRPVAEGLFIGLGAAFGIRALLQTRISQPVAAIHPDAILVSVIPLLVAAAIACYVPARRASLVDPNVALREM